jgi:hypothetical protein
MKIKELMKNKLFIIITSVVIGLLIVGLVLGFLLTKRSDNTIKLKNGQKVAIRLDATKQIEYEEFNNGLLKMEIPKGWKVDIPKKVTFSGYSFKVYNPDDKDYTFTFSLGFSGFLKSEAARKKWSSLYPSSVYGQLAALDPQTTEQFYKVWSTNAKVGNKMINEEFFIPTNEFEMIENLGKLELGGDLIRGKFVNAEGKTMEGLFTATIYDAGSYRMFGLDLAPLNTYHNIMMFAPEGQFNNWASIYDHCLGTIEFTEEFMKGFNKEQASQVSTVQANAKIYDEISDMIMDSWNKRSASYDIISQKRSDATLGYERVYNTDTGEIYKAYNGFTDEYSGSDYASITDDMYTKPIAGYIEK